MKRHAIAFFALAALAAVGYFLVHADSARCGTFKWCTPVVCYSGAACNAGCVCMNPGPNGQCVSFD